MSSDQFGGVLRAVLAFAAGFLPTTVFNADVKTAIIGGVVAAGVAIWSYYTNKPGTVIAAK